MWPKMIQVNKTDVYMIGGNNLTEQYQDNGDFVVQKLTILINICTKRVELRANMNVGRQAQGICAINNYIYCVAGINKDVMFDSVERYNTLTDVWEILEEAKYPKKAFSMSLIPVQKRFIYSIGEASYSFGFNS